MIKIVVIGYLLLHILAFFVNPVYLWGVDSLSYFHPIVSIILSLILLSSLNEKIQIKINEIISKLFNRITQQKIIIILIIFAVFMFLLSSSVHFLGDGYLRIRNLEGHIFLSSSEPLDNIVHWSFYQLIKPLKIIDGSQVYMIISIICGLTVFYHFINFIIKRNYKAEITAFFILSFVSIGSIKIFFGYVESYAISSCFLILFILTSLETLENKTTSILPTIYFVIALFCHTSALFAFPALIYLYYRFWNNENGKKSVFISILMFVVISVLSILVLYLLTGESLIIKYLNTFSSQRNLLPILTENVNYGMLSLYHVSDIINLILLVSPSILLVPFIFSNIKSKLNKKTNKFISLLIIFFILLIFTFNPILGFARDWDLFSFIAFPLTLLILFLFFDNNKLILHKYIPILVIGFIHTFVFISLNSIESLSLKRSRHLAETPYWNNKAKSLLFDELGVYYRNQDDVLTAIKMNDSAYKYEENPRYLLRNANLYMTNNDPVSAEKYYSELVKTGNGSEEIYNFMADIYFETKQYDKALLYYKQSLDLNPHNFLAWNNIGLILLNRANFLDAITVFKQSLNIRPDDSRIFYYISICYFNLKDFQSALIHANQAEMLGYKKSVIETLRKEILKGSN